MPAAGGVLRRLAAGGAVAALVALACGALAAAQEKPAKKDRMAVLAAAWPDEREMAKRRLEAENLPLFRADDPLPFTLRADFSKINRERKADSSARFPGTLEFEGPGANPIPVRIGTRGHARLDVRTCAKVPLRLEFTKKDVKGTALEGQSQLKLVTHCHDYDDYEQYVLTEYLAYRLLGLLTPRSFRARLIRVTYIQAGSDKVPTARYGILIEDNSDVARRLEARVYPLKNQLFSMLDQDTLSLMTLFQYMVGNTDYSIMALHNVELFMARSGAVYPVAYDFDYSGLVGARYARADPRFELDSVRQRLYRGPCRTMEELSPALAAFAAKRDALLALVDAVPGISLGRAKDARKYLDEFLSIAQDPRRAKRALVDGCVRHAGM